MFRSATYLLLVLTAGALIVLLTLTIPQVFVQEERADLEDDLLRARATALTQLQLQAYNQLEAAQATSTEQGLVALFSKRKQAAEGEEGQPGGEVTLVSPTTGQLEPLCADLARQQRQDLVIVLDAQGKVLASSHEEGPRPGDALDGLPPIMDALKGMRRDWFWTREGEVLLTAGSPIIVTVGNQQRVAGVVMVGERLDSSLASDLASRIDPVRGARSRVELAFIQKGQRLGSSVKDAELQNLINTTASGYANSSLPGIDASAKNLVRTSEKDGRQVAYVATSLQDSEEGSKLGLVLLHSRQTPATNILDLAAAASTLDLPPGQGPPMMVIFAVAIILFLLGWLIMSNEMAGPARTLSRELERIEGNIEDGEIDIRKFRGPAYKAAKHINSILIGLRKRLERERAIAQEGLVPTEAIEAIEAEAPARPIARPTPQTRPEGLPFSGDSSEIPIGRRRVARADTGQFDLVERAAPKRTTVDGDGQSKPPVFGGAAAHFDPPPQDESIDEPGPQDDEVLEPMPEPPLEARPEDSLAGLGGASEDEDVDQSADALSQELMAQLGFAEAPALDHAPQEEPPPHHPEADEELFEPEDDALIDPDEELLEPEPEPEPADALGGGLFDFGDSELQEALDAAASSFDGSQANIALESFQPSMRATAQQPEDDDNEDSTVDLGPDQLRRLISNSGTEEPSADVLDALGLSGDDDLAEPVAASGSLRTASERPTKVDSLGVVRQLASGTLGDDDEDDIQDMIGGSAIAASAPPEVPSNRTPELREVTTAEINRDDRAFKAALAASSAKLASAGTPPSRPARPAVSAPGTPISRVSSTTTEPFPREPSAVRAFPAAPVETPAPRNPFVHQAPTTPGTAPSKLTPNTEVDPDQQYFQKLFDQFLSTKEKCGESTDGLTLDKFVLRLQKNKTQLMERYNCRSVRFQVYVKAGKAALKATPIK